MNAHRPLQDAAGSPRLAADGPRLRRVHRGDRVGRRDIQARRPRRRLRRRLQPDARRPRPGRQRRHRRLQRRRATPPTSRSGARPACSGPSPRRRRRCPAATPTARSSTTSTATAGTTWSQGVTAGRTAGDARIAWFPGDGRGGLGTPIVSGPGVGADVLASGDFNEDGKLDIAFAGFNDSGSVAGILEGDGHGYFYTVFDRSLPGYGSGEGHSIARRRRRRGRARGHRRAPAASTRRASTCCAATATARSHRASS